MMNYHNTGGDTFALQNQFTAFVQTAVWRTRSRYIQSAQKVQHTEIPYSFEFEKGAFPEDRESAFFYASSNFDDFGKLQDTKVSVAELLYQLSSREQLILKLHIFNDLSFRTIATILEKNENTIKAIYYTAIKKLAHQLGGEDEWIF